MGGDVTKSGPGVSGPARIRPHWWAVLAVALSLLALVAAVASQHPGPLGHRRDAATTPAGHRRKTVTQPTSPPTTTTTLAIAPRLGTPTTSATGGSPIGPGDNAGTAARRLVTAAATTPATTTTTTTTPSTLATTTTTSTGSDAAAPVQPSAPTQTWTGALQQPDDPAAGQPFTGAGPRQVSASWAPAVTVSLTVTCPSGAQTKEGSSNIVMVITDATGACDFTLKEMVVQYDAVTYSLSIGPADEG